MKRLIATVTLLMASAAHAEFLSGNDLSKWLGDEKLAPAATGYIIGAADTLHGIIHCRPQSVTAQQVIEIVRKNIQLYPERLHLSADSVVTEALKQLWPCPDRRRPPGERTL